MFQAHFYPFLLFFHQFLINYKGMGRLSGTCCGMATLQLKRRKMSESGPKSMHPNAGLNTQQLPVRQILPLIDRPVNVKYFSSIFTQNGTISNKNSNFFRLCCPTISKVSAPKVKTFSANLLKSFLVMRFEMCEIIV